MKKHQLSVAFIFLYFAVLKLGVSEMHAQQFVGDNQWVAPKGVATLIATAGQKYMMLDATVALIQEWEFNLQGTYYYKNPRKQSEAYIAPTFYVKHRFWQNASETSGYALSVGTGVVPQHLDQGEVASSFRSWWATGVATFAFKQNQITWDLLPGAIANLDHKQSGSAAWGFSYASRVAVYKIIPQSAIVAEVFGTAGKAFSPTSYRAGVRWESPNWVIAGTYSNAFDGSNFAGYEIGVMFFTDPLFGKKKKEN